jgi:hypothetical protein
MRRWQEIAHDVKAGWARLRYGSVRAATRALEEAERLRLRLEIAKLDAKIQDLCREIGERAVDLHEQGESPEQILHDGDILQGANRVMVLKGDRAKLVAEMEDVRS